MSKRLIGLSAVALLLVGAGTAACGGGEAAPSAETATSIEAGTTTAGATSRTSAPETISGTGAPTNDDPEAGAQIFASAGCGSCHTLEAAGSNGAVGPNLDELRPTLDAVLEQVADGGGGMPAFAGRLSEQDIRDVAAFVVQSTAK